MKFLKCDLKDVVSSDECFKCYSSDKKYPSRPLCQIKNNVVEVDPKKGVIHDLEI